MSGLGLVTAGSLLSTRQAVRVTVGNSGSNYGFLESVYGSILPVNVNLKLDHSNEIRGFGALPTLSIDFQLFVEGGGQAAQDLWSHLLITANTGFRIYKSADATYRYVGVLDRTFWEFGDGTSPLWTVASSGVQKVGMIWYGDGT